MNQKSCQKSKKRRSKGRTAVATAATLLLIIAAAAILIYKDYFTSDSLKSLFKNEASQESESEPFTYEAGADQVFARAGNGLAVASTTGMQLIDSDGNAVIRQVFSMDIPAVAASKKHCAFYDIGGTTLRLASFDGKYTELDTERPIISVTISSGAYLCVTTEETGYKGKVTVYDVSLTPVYQWFSGSGYVLSAAVGPDNSSLAVLCADGEGGVIRFFSLDSEKERGSFTAPAELFVDLYYMGDGRLCAISENRLVFLNSKGEMVNSFDFGENYLIDYEFSKDFTAVILGKYRSGSEGRLLTVDSNGQVLGEIPLQRDVLSLSAWDRQLLVLYSDSLYLYTQELSEKTVRQGIWRAKKVILREKGDALLLSAYSAELLNLG
ncbi:MAG TPA: hypothetical protein GXZ52_05135 [Clostridiales bacterium]|jgi:WD40 repeat protein|nr:hypothetical protein [Clostridiales bacterium]